MRGAAAADWTGQDRGGVATSTEEPARPRAPQSRGPGPVTDGPRKGEQRRRRRRGGSGDTMSSPSPGKRRMDTDVVKLYPSWRGDSGCNGGGGVGMPRAPPETQSGALGHSRPLFEASSLLSLPPVPTAAPWQLPGIESLFSSPFICSTPKCGFFPRSSCTPSARDFPPRRLDSQNGAPPFYFAGPASHLSSPSPLSRSLSFLLALDLGTRDRNSRVKPFSFS